MSNTRETLTNQPVGPTTQAIKIATIYRELKSKIEALTEISITSTDTNFDISLEDWLHHAHLHTTKENPKICLAEDSYKKLLSFLEELQKISTREFANCAFSEICGKNIDSTLLTIADVEKVLWAAVLSDDACNKVKDIPGIEASDILFFKLNAQKRIIHETPLRQIAFISNETDKNSEIAPVSTSRNATTSKQAKFPSESKCSELKLFNPTKTSIGRSLALSASEKKFIYSK